MGLSSKQVSEDIHYWPQGGLEFPKPDVGEEKQNAPLRKCPRCESTNTKFCYYNNYSRSQPRHFCRVCRRHWTEGGTLRNIPVGGGRKNKRRKITSTVKNPTAPVVGELKGPIFPNILRQVPHFPTALAAEPPKVDTLSSLFGASLPNTSLTFMQDLNGVSSSSCQYNWSGVQDVGGGCENGIVGMMETSTIFPANYWDFWDGGAVGFSDGGSVEPEVP